MKIKIKYQSIAPILIFVLLLGNFLFPQTAPKTNDNRQSLWKKEIKTEIAGAPVIFQDNIVFAGRDGFLYCLNGEGKPVWEKKVTDIVLAPPSMDSDGFIDIATGSNRLLRYSLTGEKVWDIPLDAPGRATPLSDGTHVYAADEAGGVYAVSIKTKAIIWKTALNAPVFSSPVFMKSRSVLLVPSKDYFLFALDVKGSILWKFNTKGVIFSSPAVTKTNDIYITAMDHHLYKISAAGKLIHTFKAGYWNRVSPVIDAKGNVYFGSYDGYFYCIGSDGKQRWKTKGNLRFETEPVIDSEGTIYCGDNQGVVYAFSPKGKILWTHPLSGLVKCGLSIYSRGKLLLVAGADMTLYAFPINGTLATEACWPKYLGNERNSGYCD